MLSSQIYNRESPCWGGLDPPLFILGTLLARQIGNQIGVGSRGGTLLADGVYTHILYTTSLSDKIQFFYKGILFQGIYVIIQIRNGR